MDTSCSDTTLVIYVFVIAFVLSSSQLSPGWITFVGTFDVSQPPLSSRPSSLHTSHLHKMLVPGSSEANESTIVVIGYALAIGSYLQPS